METKSEDKELWVAIEPTLLFGLGGRNTRITYLFIQCCLDVIRLVLAIVATQCKIQISYISRIFKLTAYRYPGLM